VPVHQRALVLHLESHRQATAARSINNSRLVASAARPQRIGDQQKGMDSLFALVSWQIWKDASEALLLQLATAAHQGKGRTRTVDQRRS